MFTSSKTYFDQVAIELPRYLMAFIIFTVFWGISRLQRIMSTKVIDRIENDSRKAYSILIARVTRIALVFIGAVIGLSIIGVNWTALATGFGLVGFGISFAFKDYLENFLGGVIVLTQRPFIIGDQVHIGETHGIVQRISTRYTVIKDFDNKQVTVPNSEMLKKSVIKDNAYGRKRYEVEFELDYKTDLKKALTKGLTVVQKSVGVLTKPKPRGVITDFKDHIVLLRYYFWAHPREVYEFSVRSKIRQNMLTFFENENIKLGVKTSAVISKNKRVFDDRETPGKRKKEEDDIPIEEDTSELFDA
ncbi:mechanosensitive ion channel family protein [Patescibacteria group bacterium]|nr:mechanosensitive ion channel family protein [Patescibacteria group bacterium]